MKEENRDYLRGLYYKKLAEEKPKGWVGLCVRAATEDYHQFVRSYAFVSLREAPDSEVIEAGVHQFTSMHHYVRWRTIKILRRRPISLVLLRLKRLIEEFPLTEEQAVDIVEFLALTNSKASQELILKLLERFPESQKIKHRCAKALGKIKGEKGIPFLKRLLKEGNLDQKKAAVKSLINLNQRIGSIKYDRNSELRSIILSLKDIDQKNRDSIESFLSSIPIEAILSLLRSKDSKERRTVAKLISCLPKESLLIEKITKEIDFKDLDPIIIYWFGENRLIDKDRLIQILKERKTEPQIVSSILTAFIERKELDDELIELLLKEKIDKRLLFPVLKEKKELLDNIDKDLSEWIDSLKDRLIDSDTEPSLLETDIDSPSSKWPFGLEKIEEVPKRKFQFSVCAVQFSYDANLGVLIRTAEGAGAKEVVVLGADFFNRSSAKGADQYIPVVCFEDEDEFILYLRSKGYILIGVQQSSISIDIYKFKFPKVPPAFIFGSEGEGLPLSIRKRLDCMIELPMYGYIDSINVTNAASVVIYFYLKQLLNNSS